MDKRSEREFLNKEDSDSPNAHLITHKENKKAQGGINSIVECNVVSTCTLYMDARQSRADK